ncbi:MAG: single-stranded-DNA-specific exonuclease RecJ, partial [Candidatus Kaiserbacteria bacterium]|nr:single-stranded-DNA-specific exonuclease RecJ [Candidatus Kaiserbacteria bacterium]
DGIPGAAILSDFFSKIEYKNVEIYIPHRDREGYGFHEEAIKALAERGVTLIITVDVGTTARDAVKYAKEIGVDVIVTDHHEILGALPDAVAVLNPKLGPPTGGYPFRDLCGAAVAFKLVQALLQEGRKHSTPHFHDIPAGWEKWLLDLVGIATIADMVPLHGENRVLAHFGLAVLRKSPRPGIQALCNRLRLRQRELTEDDIGFSFAPRINAASRMDNPDLALHLLTTRDSNEAEKLAANLDQLNTSRKGVVSGVVREAKKRVRERFNKEERLVVLGNTEWKPSLLGLACNSLVEERGGIVCLWGRDAKGNLKGSCRSDGSISVVELFANSGESLLEYGGHNAAGGFSVAHEKVHTLHEDLVLAAKDLWKDLMSQDKISNSDARASLSEVTPQLFKEVSCLAPFGIGNSKPVFLVTGATVSAVRKFGRTENHIEVLLSCARTGVTARAFDFFKTADSFTRAPEAGAKIDLLATIERDSYRGGLALRIVDIIPAT